jgi:hypothetical protein
MMASFVVNGKGWQVARQNGDNFQMCAMRGAPFDEGSLSPAGTLPVLTAGFCALARHSQLFNGVQYCGAGATLD